MRREWHAAIIAGLGLLVAASARANPPIEAFAQLPTLSAPHLSPDGLQFAVLKPVNGKEAVVIYSVAKDAKPKLFNDTTWSILNVRWANNDRFIVTVKAPGSFQRNLYTWYRTISLSTQGGDPVVPFQGDSAMSVPLSTAYVTGVDLDDPNHITMPFSGDLYRVDVSTGERSWIARGWGRTYDWIVDGHGHAMGRLDYDTANQRALAFANTGSWTSIAPFTDLTDGLIANLGLTSDAKGFVYLAANGSGKRGLMHLDLTAGATPGELYFDPQYDVETAITDEWTNHVLGAVVVTDRPEDRYIDANRQSLQSRLQAAFPGLTVHIASVDAAHDRAIVTTSGPAQPTDLLHRRSDVGANV